MAAALVSGFLWELINFWSPTKWEYLVQRDSPHLFEMPILGYLGFIPFAFSVFGAYILQLRVRPRLPIIAALYASSLAALYLVLAV